jgi:hypothetical protein
VALSFNPTYRQAEIGFAAALACAAAWTFMEAGNYPSQSAGYPRFLSVVLGCVSLLVILRALLARSTAPEKRFLDHGGRFLLGFAALFIYVVAVDLLGYVVPSLVFGMGLPMLLGYTNLRLIVPVVVGTILMILIVFAHILERPLPPDVLDPFLEVVL